jgi:hypothetical protein
MSFKDFISGLNKNIEGLDDELDDMDVNELHENVVKGALAVADISVGLQNNRLRDIVHNQEDRTNELLFNYTVLLDAKTILEEEIKKLEGNVAKIDSKLKLVEYYLKTY